MKRIKTRLEQKYFRLSSGIKFTQGDIRSLQLGKSAILTGIEILSEKHGIEHGEIGECYITGSFGNSLSPETLKKLGIVPESIKTMRFIEEAALKGSILCLLSDWEENNFDQIKRIEHVPIVSESSFQERFIRNLNF